MEKLEYFRHYKKKKRVNPVTGAIMQKEELDYFSPKCPHRHLNMKGEVADIGSETCIICPYFSDYIINDGKNYVLCRYKEKR